MPGAHFVLTRVGGTLVVTLQDAADEGTLTAASQALMEELGQRGAQGNLLGQKTSGAGQCHELVFPAQLCALPSPTSLLLAPSGPTR
jgi:hypothetical protein